MAKPPPEAKPPKGDDPEPGARRMPFIAFLLLAIALPVLLQSLVGFTDKDPIRYDELVRYVREDRVDWVHLSDREILGAYKQGQKPARVAGSHKDRPDHFSTVPVGDDTLVLLLQEHHVAFRGVLPSAFGDQWGWLLYLGVSVLFMVLLFGGMFKRMGGAAGGALAFGKSRGKIAVPEEAGVDFDDVAGAEEAKQELLEIIEFLKTPEKFQRLGAKIPKGVLLVGPPGTGKTLMARAVAGEAKVPFISISGSEFVEMFVGVGAARVRDLFEQAAKVAPAIVFIDELDAIGRSRGATALGGGTNEEREQTLNQLLVEMDGFQPRKAVIIMAATNRPEILDQALLRPGRFDRQIVIDRPDRRGRLAILAVHTRGVPLGPELSLEEIAARTPGFAGADLANLVNEAALLAARHGHDFVTSDDISAAVDRVVAGLERRSRVINPEERRRVAYHEVGHALVGTLAGTDDRVHKISIIPRGVGALGYTMQLPAEEHFLMTEEAIQNKLASLLGGRAAEEVVFGQPSSGAQDDLRKATDIARAMVTEFGMSDAVGPVSLSGDRRNVFLGSDGGPHFTPEMSPGLAETVDKEVERLVRAALARAKELIETHRERLDHVAAELLEAEVLEGAQLDALLRGLD